MAVNYEDERLQAVEEEKQEALNEAEKTYGDMISKAEETYQEQIDANKAWEEQQKQIQQEQTDFAIEQTEKQKEQYQKDYLKEQSGAYTDWQKQKNAYGVEAEQMAAAGLAGSGFSESAQVSMYNAYQARVTAARESMTKAIADFDSAMQAAILQNNAAMAEIAFQALQQRLTLTIESFQYQNQLLLALEEQKQSIADTYYGRWLDVLDQLNAEEALAIAQAQKNNGSGGGTGSGNEEELFLNPTGPGYEGGPIVDPSAVMSGILQPMGLLKGKGEILKNGQPTLKATNGPNAQERAVMFDDGGGGGLPGIVVDPSLSGYTDEELEQMILSGKVTVTERDGNYIISPK